MISGHEFYAILKAILPLYVAMFLAYGSVRWWKIFTPDQCTGINRFVAIFAVPFLSFHFISTNNPYTMNFRFLAADTLQKIIMLLVLALFVKFTKRGSLDWMITIFSLSTLPNTLVIGIPLLSAMFGEFSASLMVQLVVVQCIIWYTLLLFLFELHGAKMLIMEKFPESGAAIASFKVDSDVVSLDGQDFLETEAEMGDDGKLHVRVRKSNVSRRSFGVGSLSGAEIFSLSSSSIHSPRGSNFNQADCYSVTRFPGGRLSNFGPAVDLYSVQSSMRPSNVEEDLAPVALSKSSAAEGHQPPQTPSRSKPHLQQNGRKNKVNPDVHMFARSSSAPIVSQGCRVRTDLRPTMQPLSRPDQHGANEIRMLVSNHPQNDKARETEEFGNEIRGEKETMKLVELKSVAEQHPNVEAVPDDVSGKQMPSAIVMTRLVVIMVWRKLARNPNLYASILGLIWALVSFRWHVGLPKIIGNSISLISDTGLGMAMFSLGLFMALQPRIIACGISNVMVAMVAKFVIGPLVMAMASLAVGLHGTLLHISIVQATLSEAIVPFVFAKEYNVHPTILSTAVISGMLITVPITLCYYIILQH